MKLAVLSANLGGIDKPVEHEKQSVEADYFDFTDENFPIRKSMTYRLQAKIPKMFGWQLKPDYDVYMWLDGNIALAHPDSLRHFLDALEGYDIVVLHHPDRNTVWWEYRYTWRGLHSSAPSNYMVERYKDEFLEEQIGVIMDDPDFEDDRLFNGGIFMYRNTPRVHQMLKEWFYHVSRYQSNDQIPFPYVLQKSDVSVAALGDVFRDCPWLKNERHRLHK